jgi:SWI/SNF-related matrix-associated actin-dependent regulator of chromatin subfamily A3
MDLAANLKFLRVYPFDELATFEQEILQPWLGCKPDSLLRLRLLVKSIALCRSNNIANLPMRFDQIHRLEFSPAEADLYETTKRRTDSSLEEAISANCKRQDSNLNGLRWLNSLRLICNHGVMHRKIGSPEASSELAQRPRKVNALIAQELFDGLLSTGAAICAGCSVNLTEVLAEDLDSNLQPELSECLFLFCGACSKEKASEKYRVTCQHGASCRAFEVSIGGPSTPCKRQRLSIVMSETDTPTKIKALLLDLQKYGRKTKR